MKVAVFFLAIKSKKERRRLQNRPFFLFLNFGIRGTILIFDKMSKMCYLKCV